MKLQWFLTFLNLRVTSAVIDVVAECGAVGVRIKPCFGPTIRGGAPFFELECNCLCIVDSGRLPFTEIMFRAWPGSTRTGGDMSVAS